MVSIQSLRYLGKRLIFGVFTVWAVTALVFLLMHLAPGSIVDTVLGGGVITDEMRQRIIEQYHLDEPVYVQYLLWAGDLLRGTSASRTRPDSQSRSCSRTDG
ncbi:hypothetical protein ACFQJD_19005 [Haloplanus sp. GCM10025708]|uniref:hypothetical protein n=1 Tax=Haloferacaceae TaxID=1644056 RepID=UPI0036062ED0